MWNFLERFTFFKKRAVMRDLNDDKVGFQDFYKKYNSFTPKELKEVGRYVSTSNAIARANHANNEKFDYLSRVLKSQFDKNYFKGKDGMDAVDIAKLSGRFGAPEPEEAPTGRVVQGPNPKVDVSDTAEMKDEAVNK